METVKREGIDIVFAVDVSKSMLAEDVAPSRLEKSKQDSGPFTNLNQNDRNAAKAKVICITNFFQIHVTQE